ncbi:MAG TPA: DMT family transporter, partial [Roseomonas sp.]|nr:DMT family transporter [Roseomonas sp.]
PPVSLPPQRILLGVFFICLAGLQFAAMTGIAKHLGATYSSLQISWARAFVHVPFLLIAFLPRHGLGVLRTRRPFMQLARSALLFTSNLSTFFALTFIPLAKAASISQTAPLIVTALAGPMLGERTTRARVVAVCCGFLGVLLVIRPGSAVFHWAALAVLLSAVSYATYQILTRKVAGVESAETSAVYSSMVGAFGMLLVIPFVWVTPHSLVDWGLFVAVGMLGAMGHYCIALAFGFGPANILSPFQYFQLLSSVLVGYVAFGEVPDAYTWVGGLVIVASGIFIGWSQTRKAP